MKNYKIKVVNRNGNGQDTRIFAIDNDTQEIVDITSCFFDAKISIPANGKTELILYAHPDEIESTSSEVRLIIDKLIDKSNAEFVT